MNIIDVTNAVKKERVTGVKIVKEEQEKCETCLKEKMARKPFPAESTRKTEILEIIHTDVCGLM